MTRDSVTEDLTSGSGSNTVGHCTTLGASLRQADSSLTRDVVRSLTCARPCAPVDGSHLITMHRKHRQQRWRGSRHSTGRNLRKSGGAAAVGGETALVALGGRRYPGEAGRDMAGPRSTPISL